MITFRSKKKGIKNGEAKIYDTKLGCVLGVRCEERNRLEIVRKWEFEVECNNWLNSIILRLW